MDPDAMMLALRNLLLVQLAAVLALAVNFPLLRQELLWIWKTLKTPLQWKRPARPNHKSGKFWEIDMSDFEP